MTARILPFVAQDDPIFAAIETHRAARREYLRAAENTTATDEQLDPLCDKMDRAMERLMSIKPTTVKGTLAFLRYRREHEITVEGAAAVECAPAWQIIASAERALAGMIAS
ncbi:MAG: hypothetical protein HYX37_14785 [Rhizobiales bacterium]|nr:hypothetical protein [Hyphomicrobiales bacterium]